MGIEAETANLPIKELKINDVLVAKYQAHGTHLFMRVIPNMLAHNIADPVFEGYVVNTICIIEKQSFEMISYLNID